MKLLILETDVQSATLRSQWFSAQNYLVDVVMNGHIALDCLQTTSFDVILLGNLSDITSVELCRVYRRLGGQTPILMISSDPQHHERWMVPCLNATNALDSGADDFVQHACPMTELSARVRALLRRPPAVLNDLLQTGKITMNTTTSTIIRDGVEIHLQPMEFNLLEFFLRHPNQVFSTRALHERIWRGQIARGTTSDTVRTHMKTLRRKIDEPGKPSIITSVHGRGYKLTIQTSQFCVESNTAIHNLAYPSHVGLV